MDKVSMRRYDCFHRCMEHSKSLKKKRNLARRMEHCLLCHLRNNRYNFETVLRIALSS
jgi:hypothetical protein